MPKSSVTINNVFFNPMTSDSAPTLMAIINLTPDSFSGDGLFGGSLANIIRLCAQRIEEGASILDLGAESTRPGAARISLEEEWQRLAPVLKALVHEKLPATLSIDTYKAEIARRALEEGANMINDINNAADPDMLPVVAHYKKPYVLMHNQAARVVDLDPKNKGTVRALYPQKETRLSLYERVVQNFTRKIQKATAAGIAHAQLILDPGFGFAKTYEENFQLFSMIPRLKKKFGLPVLAGVSRKSFITRLLGSDLQKRDAGSLSANLIAHSLGANFLRCHDIVLIASAIKIHMSIRSFSN